MNIISRVITGTTFIIFGVILLAFASKTKILNFFYGLPFLIIGFFILFNIKEDKIEKRKDLKRGKSR